MLICTTQRMLVQALPACASASFLVALVACLVYTALMLSKWALKFGILGFCLEDKINLRMTPKMFVFFCIKSRAQDFVQLLQLDGNLFADERLEEGVENL